MQNSQSQNGFLKAFHERFRGFFLTLRRGKERKEGGSRGVNKSVYLGTLIPEDLFC